MANHEAAVLGKASIYLFIPADIWLINQLFWARVECIYDSICYFKQAGVRRVESSECDLAGTANFTMRRTCLEKKAILRNRTRFARRIK